MRRYTTEFSDHFSKRANTKGKKRRYTENDLVILGRIRTLKTQRLGNEEINKRLQVSGGPDQPEGFSLALIPAFQEKLGTIDAVQRDHQLRLDDVDDWRSTWVMEWNAYNAKGALSKLWMRITGRAPSRPPGM